MMYVISIMEIDCDTPKSDMTNQMVWLANTIHTIVCTQ